MSLRIGYVNVQGLNTKSWDTVCSLLRRTFDFLFLAETWFVNHAAYSRDRRVVASTPFQDAAYRTTRSSGGIYLLATYKARARIKRYSVPSEYAISFSVGRYIISGVYFSPSLPSLDVEYTLSALSYSSVILGDINTRFRHCPFQDGQPGPPERTSLFSTFLRPGTFVRATPVVSPSTFNGVKVRSYLTVDHCFLRRALLHAKLRLLDCKSIRLQTDHLYTLHLTLYVAERVPPPPRVLRYRISRMSSANVSSELPQYFNSLARTSTKPSPTLDVDQLNTRLVELCQNVAETVLGQARVAPPSSMPSKSKDAPVKYREQTNGASVRLYKQAVASSKENTVILPSSRSGPGCVRHR